jgi:tRNA pseudouridine55 synthase
VTAPSLDGVLVLDKPRGPTSHDVVFRVRRALRTRAVGHAGTLDPMATGVLVVAVGEATKLVPWLTAHDKGYAATIELGVETDTLDAEGREVRRVAPSDELREALRQPGGTDENGLPAAPAALRAALRAAFEGERERTLQIPPSYSAIRTDGERAFTRARRGEVVELEARSVVVHRLELAGWTAEPPSLEVTLDVGKGYYVRALARDLATALGTAGHLTALRRTRSGCFTVAEAVSPDTPPEALRAAVEPLAQVAARALPVARLSETGARDARYGRPVQASDLEEISSGPPHVPCAWVDGEGRLVAVGEREDDGRGRVLRGFGEDPSRGGG